MTIVGAPLASTPSSLVQTNHGTIDWATRSASRDRPRRIDGVTVWISSACRNFAGVDVLVWMLSCDCVLLLFVPDFVTIRDISHNFGAPSTVAHRFTPNLRIT